MSEAAVLQTQTAKPGQSSSAGLLPQHKCACGGSGGFAGECSECRSKKLLGKPLQTKLRINEPGDEYEQEADRVADQVMRIAEPGKETGRSRTVTAPLVHRKVNAIGAGIDTAPPVVHDVLCSPGQPLDAATRAFFEPRFGHDFSNVRIHLDTKAAESARAVNAAAYTVGHHVVLGAAGSVSPATMTNSLLAHELAHVSQQAQSGSLAIQRKGDPRSTAAWEFASNYRRYEPETYENLLAEVGTARETLEAEGARGFLSEYDLQLLVRLTALDLMDQYRRRIITERDSVKVAQQPGEIVANVRAASEKILNLDAQRRLLERSRSNIAALAARTNIGGASPFTEEWARQVAAYTKEYRNEEITTALQEFATWVTEHQTVTEGDRSQGAMLLYKLENARTKQIQGVTRRVNKLYTQFPFLAQLWLRDPATELAEAVIGDPAGDIVSGAQAASETAASLIGRFDPTGLFAKGRAYAEAQVTTAVRKLSGPSLSDFTENTFGTSASYIDAVRQAYDQLIENIDRAIGVIGSEDISPFELPEAVEAAREGLPANLKKELEQLRQRKELVALAKTLGLAAAEAGLALLPVIGPALAFGVGLYSSVSDLESALDRRTLGLAGETPEGMLGVKGNPAEVAMSIADVTISAAGVFEFLDVPEIDVDVPTRERGSVPTSRLTNEMPATRPTSVVETPIAEGSEISNPVGQQAPEILAGNEPRAVVSPSAPDKLPDLTADEQSLLRETADPINNSGELPQHLADQELDIVRRAEKTEIVDQGDGYIYEVDLGNGHKWKGKKDGTWCRYSNGGTNCTNLPGEPPPDDVDLGEVIGVHLESPRLRQLIALLDDLLIRSHSKYHRAIESLRNRVTYLMEQSPANEPLDPVAINDLALKVDELRNLVGEEIMFQGGKVPAILRPESIGEIPFHPGERAVPSLALPRRVGMYAPREFSGDARGVTRRVLGDPPDFDAAFERLPQIPYDRNIDGPLIERLYSHIHLGGSGTPVYLTTLRVEGRSRVVAVKHYQKDFGDYQRAEVVKATILGELGVGPRVFGVVEIDGKPGLVMEAVAGDFPEAMPMGQQAVWDLEIAEARMTEAGVAIGDFQYFVTPEGRAVIIDAGGALIEGTDPRFASFLSEMGREVKEKGVRLNAPPQGPDLRERYRSQIRARAEKSFVSEFQGLQKSSSTGTMTVEGVAYDGVHVTLEGNDFAVRVLGIENVSRVPGRGRLVNSAFEQAAIEAARATGASSARVGFEKVVNQNWRAYLEEQGYTRIIEKVGAKGFRALWAKVFPI